MKIVCPKCNSDQLTANQKGFSGGKAVAGAVLTGGIGLLAGLHGSKKVVTTCLACGNKFGAGEGKKIAEPGDPPAKLPPPPVQLTPEQKKAQTKGCLWVLATIVFIGVVMWAAGGRSNGENVAGTLSSESNYEEPSEIKNLDASDYEIIADASKGDVKNYHVFITSRNTDSSYVTGFMKRFREEYCSGKCNVNLYDSKKIASLVTKYPIKGKEYILLADHLVATTSFDSPNTLSWYPLQDFFYREQGGKNWKKQQMK